MRSRRSAFGGSVLCVALSSASAQNVYPANMTGQPLQYMHDGAISGCGLRIVAVEVADDLSSEASELSLNFYDSGVAIVKATAYAPIPLRKPTPQPVKVASAWAKAPGANATKPLGVAEVGEDHLSQVYATDLENALAIVGAQTAGTPVQISVRRPLQRTYRILSGVVTMSPAEGVQLRSCLSELVEKMQSKLPDAEASSPQ